MLGVLGVLGPIIIGFAAGMIARFLKPGKTNPSGFVLTILLGIAGAFAATFLGQFFGFYDPGEQAGFGGTIVGAVLVLIVWGWVARKKDA
jgi:uncharacterized membrane protein YeaQ/YmgE (transglycosylase-associated protein family)